MGFPVRGDRFFDVSKPCLEGGGLARKDVDGQINFASAGGFEGTLTVADKALAREMATGRAIQEGIFAGVGGNKLGGVLRSEVFCPQ